MKFQGMIHAILRNFAMAMGKQASGEARSLPEQQADQDCMFVPNFRRELRLGKYTRWASDLSEDQFAAVLWVVGEYGGRARIFQDLIDKCASECDPSTFDDVAYARFRLAGVLLEEMVCGKPCTVEEVKSRIRGELQRLQHGEPGPGS